MFNIFLAVPLNSNTSLYLSIKFLELFQRPEIKRTCNRSQRRSRQKLIIDERDIEKNRLKTLRGCGDSDF